MCLKDFFKSAKISWITFFHLYLFCSLSLVFFLKDNYYSNVSFLLEYLSLFPAFFFTLSSFTFVFVFVFLLVAFICSSHYTLFLKFLFHLVEFFLELGHPIQSPLSLMWNSFLSWAAPFRFLCHLHRILSWARLPHFWILPILIYVTLAYLAFYFLNVV